MEEAHDSPGFLLWMVCTQWQRAIATSLKPHGLTQVQFVLLASLLWLSAREEHITQVRLARHARMDVMTTSQVLGNLERRKLVTRKAHPTDTRAKALQLTKAGMELTRRAVPDVEREDARFFSGLGKQDAGFIRALRLLAQP